MKTQRLEKYSERFDNDKSPIGNTETWGKRLVEEPKQKSQNLKNFKKLVSNEVSPAMKDFIKEKETLEEAFNKIVDSSDYVLFDYASFEEGAKWQQERSYSEEDMEIAFGTMSTNWISFEQFIKQFKNK
jgi:hypothetical protein